MTTALRTLLTGISENSFKLLSLVSESTALANALPRTKANFDGNGSTFANDAAVSSGPMAGVGAATNATDDIQAFSGVGIHDSGKAAAQGGGHTNSGDGTVYTFDPEIAAGLINLGGSGDTWKVGLKSCRYIDAFTNGRPSAVNSPAGNQQDPPTTPAGANAGYWLWPSADGVNMPGAGHTYHYNRFIPGTNKMLISQWGSMDPNQGASPNAGYVYDIVANTMTGPLITTAGMPANGGVTVYGYAQDNNGAATTMGVGVDGCAYSVTLQNFAYRLYQWTNPTTSALALVDTGAFSGSTQPNMQQAAALVFADPANPGQLIYFQHSYNPGDGGSDANFMVVTGLNGGTPTMSFHNYASGTVVTDGLGFLDYDYDTVRKKIVMTDGQHLFTVTPDPGGNLDAWVIAQITGFTGDTPPDATVSGNSPFPAIRYLAAEDCYAHAYSGGYRVYKPIGWSPPSTGGFPWQNWGLDAWSLASSGTVASGAGTAAGSATVSGVSAAIKKAAGTSAGVATATGHGASLAKSAGSSAGVASATGHGAALAKSAGTAAGAATVSGVGKSLALSHGTAAGVATATGVGKSLSLSHGTAAGVATVSGHGASLAKSVGNAAGLATVAGVGTSSGGGSTGIAAGVATVSGHGASLFAAHGTASGVATVLGRSASIFAARGTSAGLATVRGVSPSAAVVGIQSISRRGRKPNLPMGFE